MNPVPNAASYYPPPVNSMPQPGVRPTHQVIITPPPPPPKPAHDYSNAVILCAKYGDFASRRLVNVGPQLIKVLQKNGKLLVGTSYNALFGDPCPGIKKALLIVWTHNLTGPDAGIHWGIVSENERSEIKLYKKGFDHYVDQFPAGVYGDFASGKWVDVRSVLAERFRGTSLAAPSYNSLFGDPAVGIVKSLIVFYSTPGRKTISISKENELKILNSMHPGNEPFLAYRK